MSRLSAIAVLAPMLLTIVVELLRTGSRWMSSFHGLFAGRTCRVEMIASACVVSHRTFVIGGVVPSGRPSWLTRGDAAGTPRKAPPVGLLSRKEKSFPAPEAATGIVTDFEFMSPAAQESEPDVVV